MPSKLSPIGSSIASGGSGGGTIGGLVTGGTPNSVLFVGAGGVLSQDNTYFKIAGTGADKVLTVGFWTLISNSGGGSQTLAGGAFNTTISTGGGTIAFNDGKTSLASDGSLTMSEQTAPASPAANKVTIYAVDNGAGKTQLMALFASGVAQQIAIEP